MYTEHYYLNDNEKVVVEEELITVRKKTVTRYLYSETEDRWIPQDIIHCHPEEADLVVRGYFNDQKKARGNA